MNLRRGGEESWDERLVHTAQGYVARAWRMSPRETLHQARRYSAFVRVMKRALPLAALALALAVLVYALQPRPTGQIAMTFESMGTVENDLTMINPRLTGTDSNGLPFVVTASAAVQEGQGAARVRLEHIAAELTLGDGTVLHVTAASGVVDNATRLLEIRGGIRFTATNGYTAETESANADLNSGIVSGNAPVAAEGALGRLTAEGFTFERQTGTFHFIGGVHMQLYGRGS